MGHKLTVAGARRRYLSGEKYGEKTGGKNGEKNGETDRYTPSGLELHLLAVIQQQWKSEVRHLAPSAQRAWLKRSEVIACLGAARCAKLRKNLDRLEKTLTSTVPGGAWLVAALHRGDEFPPGGTAQTRMVLGRAMVRWGEGGRARRRYTPSIAVRLEDRLDERGERAACGEISCSAVMIERIRQLGATESKGRRPRYQRRLIAFAYPDGRGGQRVGFA